MTPLQRYDRDVSEKFVSLDNGQRSAVQVFDDLFHKILRKHGSEGFVVGFVKKLFKNRSIAEPEIKGVYLWGGVGRGKTYLMDLFYECIPFNQKERTHFHRFMSSVHKELKNLQGRKNPLDLIATRIADRVKILCFDEFFVSDIGDAMLLAGLFEALFRRGVVLVATSNIHPDALYETGLQRERFLPAIHLIRMCTLVVELEKGVDYRLQKLSNAMLYHFPNNEKANIELVKKFNELAPNREKIVENHCIKVLDRDIITRYHTDDVAWFEFLALCDAPRSAFDYVEISKVFHALVVSDIPQFKEKNEDKARRFVNLIDELYDRRVKLIVSAEVSISELYKGKRLVLEFKRTESRLIEMQSRDYLGSAHSAN